MDFSYPPAAFLHDLCVSSPVHPAGSQAALALGITKLYTLKREAAQATRWATRANRLADAHEMQRCVDAMYDYMTREYPHWLQCPVNRGDC